MHSNRFEWPILDLATNEYHTVSTLYISTQSNHIMNTR
jgi:hypothetical protein